MPIEVDGNCLETDPEGYLVDPGDWSRRAAEVLAQKENIVLSVAHWIVIEFMRNYYDEHQIAADARFVVRHLGEVTGRGHLAQGDLFKLFPYGYVKQACKIAGMRKPRAWSTG